MTIVLNTALRGVADNFASFAIGMTVVFSIIGFGAVNGASINPARTLGPAIGAGNFTEVLPYTLAQFIGAAFATLLDGFIFARSIGDEKKKQHRTNPPSDFYKNRVLPQKGYFLCLKS